MAFSRKSSDFRAEEHADGHEAEKPGAVAEAAAALDGSALTPGSLMSLQQTAGNRATRSAVDNANRTGIPDQLKEGIERLSGSDLSHARVRFNSAEPAQLDAEAFTKGKDIHVGPGQEQHLGHEAWHVVQQMQGRVKSTARASGHAANDDAALEHEADVMGAKAVKVGQGGSRSALPRMHADAAGGSSGVRAGAAVVQAAGKCKQCGHKHGAATCKVKDKNGKKCGCKSHSSKWDSGSKSYGDSKRERRGQGWGGWSTDKWARGAAGRSRWTSGRRSR